MLPLTRYITDEQIGLFGVNGWTINKQDTMTVNGEKHFAATRDIDMGKVKSMAYEMVRVLVKPHFVQRGTIKRPMSIFARDHLLKSMSFDFMSFDWADRQSSPEYGTSQNQIEASLYRMVNTAFAYSVDRVDSFTVGIDGTTYIMRVFHPFSPRDFKAYVRYLLEHRKGNVRTYDLTGLEYIKERPHSIDVWWDLDNDTIITFDRNYIVRLPELLRATKDSLEAEAKASAVQSI